MARPVGTCQVCRHPQRFRIEMALAAGVSRAAIAKRYDVSPQAAGRHYHGHMSEDRKAQLVAGPVKLADLADKAAEESLALVDYLSMVRSALLHQFLAASEAGDRAGMAMLSARVLRCLEMIANLTGELRQAGSTITNNIAILNHPWVSDLQAMLIRTLQPYPEARAAVLTGLEQLSRREMASPAALPALEAPDAS